MCDGFCSARHAQKISAGTSLGVREEFPLNWIGHQLNAFLSTLASRTLIFRYPTSHFRLTDDHNFGYKTKELVFWTLTCWLAELALQLTEDLQVLLFRELEPRILA